MHALEYNLIDTYDEIALSLDSEEPDQNIYEFDLTLWNLLRLLSQRSPDEACHHFSINAETVTRLAKATDWQLSALASGILISFKLETPEREIISRLTGHYDAVVCLHGVEDFDAAYWLLLARVANKDIEIARQSFGVSRELASHVVKATNSQLRTMASNIVIHFSLRFQTSVLDDVLSRDSQDITYPILRKLLQSLALEGTN